MPQIDALHDGCRQGSDDHVHQVVEEVPVVVMPDAAASEPTVVVPLQHAHVAHFAVPGSRWHQCLTILARVPPCQLRRIQRWLQQLLYKDNLRRDTTKSLLATHCGY